jgi:FAD dependent oxidoreductase TIGR03364
MHAWWALQRDDEVIQIDRDVEARSASVRNFGLVWVSGRRDGAELDMALRARELWEQIGARVAGLGFRPHGSMTVALDEFEAAAMRTYAASDAAAARRTEWLDGAEVRAVNPAVAGVVAGALWCHSDAIVESRVALAAMRAEMAVNGRYRFIGGRRVRERHGTEVIDHCGDHYGGDVVIVCTGADHDGLDAAHLSAAPLRRCRLQMMQTEPADFSLTTSIADADSMRYYPAYEHVDLSDLAPQPPVAVDNRMQLLMVQRLDGSLTIGDTHTYDDGPSDQPFAFDVDEAPYRHLVERAEAILGRRLPPIQRRWAGVYSQLAPTAPGDAVYHHGMIEPGVIAVTGPGGRGMTLAPAIAERTWERLGA